MWLSYALIIHIWASINLLVDAEQSFFGQQCLCPFSWVTETDLQLMKSQHKSPELCVHVSLHTTYNKS